MAELISNEPSRTLDEFWIIPRMKRPEHKPENVDLRTPLVKFHKGEKPPLMLNIPLTSACMQSVAGVEIALALCGGISFIYQSQSIERQVEMIKQVKKFKAGFGESDSNLEPDNTVFDALELEKRTGHSTIAITKDGSPNGILLGVLTSRDIIGPDISENEEVRNLMTPLSRLVYGQVGMSLEEASKKIYKNKLKALPIIDKNRHLHHFVFEKDFREHGNNPNELVDGQKRLMVGAGINTWDYKQRVPALVDAGADILCIDSANGYTCWQKETVQWIRKKYGNAIKVGGGNVVDKAGFGFLVRAGVDFIKIGIGSGSICTTGDKKGLGRGGATALMEIAKVRDKFFKKKGIYIPLCYDGGISCARHMSLSLAMGADFDMMGGWFARCAEAPGKLRTVDGKPMKEHWGEATDRARNLSRYDQATQSTFAYQQGEEGYVPFVGGLKDNIEGAPEVEGALPIIRDVMCDSASLNISEFHKKACLTLISQTTMGMGGATVPKRKFEL